jgi:hypothetical protein
VTRGDFALWATRSGGRIEAISNGNDLPLATNTEEIPLDSAQITPGATNSAGFVNGVVSGSFETTQPNLCPCRVRLIVRVEGTGAITNEIDVTIPNDDNNFLDDGNKVIQGVTLPFVVDLRDVSHTPGQPLTVEVSARRFDNTVPNIYALAQGWVSYVPFDGRAYAPTTSGSSGTSSGGSSGTSSGGSSGTSSGGSSGTSG